MNSIPQVYGVIYQIRNGITGHVYIGQTKQGTKRRWEQHRNDLRNGKHGNIHLQRAWNICGESAFTFTVLEQCADFEALNVAERAHIDRLRADGIELYNFRHGGGAGERIKPRPPISEETRRKRSETFKRKGLRPPPEALEKARLASIGRVQSEEERRKKSEASKRLVRGPDFGAKVSAATRGIKKTYTPETYASMIASRKGKHHTEEHKQKIGAGGEYRNPVRRFISPDGTIYETRNVAKFAREHGLAERAMVYVANGQHAQHRGWRLAPDEKGGLT